MAIIGLTILHNRTPFLLAVYRELEARGHEVHFLCPSPQRMEWLLGQGVPAARIVDQSASMGKGPLTAEERGWIEEIAAVEVVANLTLNSMILMDRLVRHWPGEEARAYLVRLYRLLRHEIVARRIGVVLGEPTPASELLTASVCEALGIPFYFPLTTRIPDGRFAFFKGRVQSDFARNRHATPDDVAAARAWAVDFLAHFEEKKPRPSYFYRNIKPPRLRLEWLFKLLPGILNDLRYRRRDATYFPLTRDIRDRLRAVWNRFRARSVDFSDGAEVPGERFVLYSLHRQPESSIDVLGDFYSDQLGLIRQICRALPATHVLYVKEHLNGIGDRGLEFFREIEQLPNVRLVSPWVDAFALVMRSDLVVTVSGTMAYEAGLLGRPAITMAPMFFNRLETVRHCEGVRRLPAMIREQLGAPAGAREQRIEFLADIYLNSFPGLFSDARTYPEVLDPDNVAQVCDGIEAVL